ncbi:hypothetical protein Tco_0907045 [Tanacetum coccineum]|uniref:Uncharacterized protein n=1 Tax=Tanacetum coccineum TaxID=301880 RepID=A0ABQ5CIC0_9ASTR
MLRLRGEMLLRKEDVIRWVLSRFSDPEGDLPIGLRNEMPSRSKPGGKSLASLRRTLPEGSLILGSSSSADVHTHVTGRELKEKLRGKYDARGVLLMEKDAEIARMESLVKEKETESAEVLHLRDQGFLLSFTFRDFKEEMEDQQEAQGSGVVNRVVNELRHSDGSVGAWGGILPYYLDCFCWTKMAGRGLCYAKEGLADLNMRWNCGTPLFRVWHTILDAGEQYLDAECG